MTWPSNAGASAARYSSCGVDASDWFTLLLLFALALPFSATGRASAPAGSGAPDSGLSDLKLSVRVPTLLRFRPRRFTPAAGLLSGERLLLKGCCTRTIGVGVAVGVAAAGALGVRSHATFTSAALEADEQFELEDAASELGAGCFTGDERPAEGLRRVRS